MTGVVSAPRRLLAASLVAALALSAGSCATNPVTGQRQVSLFGTASEIEMGREYDQDLVKSLGLYDDPALGAYVDAIGQRMAAASERPHLPWTFRVIDDPVVNAFALPGGYIYVTRGMLAHMGSEAELAGVLGHEIGHVTARHSIHRLSRQLLTMATVGVALVVLDVEELWGAAGLAMGLAFLRHSRDDERQADELGLRYMWDAGYEPRAMVELFDTLVRATGGEEGGRVPTWLSTHPNPDRRGNRIADRIEARGGSPPDARREVDGYLARLDGLPFGEDPRRGYVHQGLLVLPRWGVSLQAPEGWKLETSALEASLEDLKGEAAVMISGVEEATLGEAMATLRKIDGMRLGAEEAGRLGGLDSLQATLELESGGSTVRGLVAFARHRDHTLRVLAITQDPRWSQYQRALLSSVRSLTPVTDPGLLEVEPMRLEPLRVTEPSTLEQLLARNPASVDLATLARINAVEPGQTLPPGRQLKWVAGGRWPGFQGALGAVGP
jgi:predicted Zn-dependent protease